MLPWPYCPKLPSLCPHLQLSYKDKEAEFWRIVEDGEDVVEVGRGEAGGSGLVCAPMALACMLGALLSLTSHAWQVLLVCPDPADPLPDAVVCF